MNAFRFVLAVFVFVLLFAAENGAPVDVKQPVSKVKPVATTLVSNVQRDAGDTSDSDSTGQTSDSTGHTSDSTGHTSDSTGNTFDSTDDDTTDTPDTKNSTDTDDKSDDVSDSDLSGRDGQSKSVSSTATAKRKPACFPANAVVTLDNGETKKMVDLEVGDRVAVGNGEYSKVFMFTHRLPHVVTEFVQLTAVNGAVLRATEGHYLYVNSKYISAGEVRVGDLLQLDDRRRVAVAAISRVQDTGLFNPQTSHGDIVVNGFQASTYTTLVPPTLAHAALAPMRAAFARLGLVFDALESGLDALAATA